MIRKLSFTLCLLGFILLAACNKSEDCSEIEFDIPFQFQQGDYFCLGSDIEIEIKKFDDQRCPCDVTCIWEGEFVFKLIISSDNTEEEYDLHEKLENEATQNLNLQFNDIIMISQDSCENMLDIDEIVFEMSISQL